MRSIRHLREKLIALAALTGFVLLRLFLRAQCPILFLTGIPCPGCGMTRACLAVLRGDFPAAFAYHGMVWSLPLLLLFFLCDGHLFRQKRINALMLFLIGIGFLANWIVKLIAGL